MKKNFIKVSTLVLVLLFSMSISSVAIDYKHPAQTLSELSGKTVKQIKDEHNQGKSYGEIAKGYGILDEFKSVKLATRKAKIDELINEKKISREEGDKMYNDFKTYLDKWDGSGNVEKKFKVGKRNLKSNREEK